jgi:RimJ/RimL family protein N-acetyltransferase
MELETPRLHLRRWRFEDRAPFAALNAEPAVLRFLAPLRPGGTDALIERFEAHFDEYGYGYWALEEKESGALIGACGLSHVTFEVPFAPAVEIGWRLSERWQGKGLAREAAQAVLDAAFRHFGLTRIVSFTVPANRASWGLMERLGMRRVGAFENPTLAEGHPLRAQVLYEITAAGAR